MEVLEGLLAHVDARANTDSDQHTCAHPCREALEYLCTIANPNPGPGPGPDPDPGPDLGVQVDHRSLREVRRAVDNLLPRVE